MGRVAQTFTQNQEGVETAPTDGYKGPDAGWYKGSADYGAGTSGGIYGENTQRPPKAYMPQIPNDFGKYSINPDLPVDYKAMYDAFEQQYTPRMGFNDLKMTTFGEGDNAFDFTGSSTKLDAFEKYLNEQGVPGYAPPTPDYSTPLPPYNPNRLKLIDEISNFGKYSINPDLPTDPVAQARARRQAIGMSGPSKGMRQQQPYGMSGPSKGMRQQQPYGMSGPSKGMRQQPQYASPYSAYAGMGGGMGAYGQPFGGSYMSEVNPAFATARSNLLGAGIYAPGPVYGGYSPTQGTMSTGYFTGSKPIQQPTTPQVPINFNPFSSGSGYSQYLSNTPVSPYAGQTYQYYQSPYGYQGSTSPDPNAPQPEPTPTQPEPTPTPAPNNNQGGIFNPFTYDPFAGVDLSGINWSNIKF